MRKALVALALFASTFAVAGVGVDRDREVVFSSYRTYAWHEGRPAASDLLQQRIVSAVDDELKARGLHETDETPDLYVVTHSVFNTDDADRPNTEDPLADWRGWGGGWSRTPADVPAVSFGTLFIDMIDARSGKLVWRGLRSGSQGNGKKIDKTVSKMFSGLPPD